jgi:hypothetical protein
VVYLLAYGALSIYLLVLLNGNHDELIKSRNMNCIDVNARLIAYYLPQYHPIPENDQWWGKGFTEWISVAQSKPLFKGHYQPILPGELGFYDLRLEESRIEQANLAKEYGIEGFCYWHYWFGNGKQLLERPFNEVLGSGKPDFPFCLAWANHDWKGVFFGAKGKTLVKQNYPGSQDAKEHFEYLVKAFKDPRYIRIHSKPLLHIYRPREIPDCKEYLNYWRELAVDAGLDGLYIVGEGLELSEKDIYGVDGVTYSSHRDIESGGNRNKYLRFIRAKLFRIPGKLNVFEYKDAIKYFTRREVCPENEFPCIVPNWDTTARLGRDAFILNNSTPELFRKHVQIVKESVKQKELETNLIYVKSWNEWAEGNYLEPDRKWGRKYLEVFKESFVTNSKNNSL